MKKIFLMIAMFSLTSQVTLADSTKNFDKDSQELLFSLTKNCSTELLQLVQQPNMTIDSATRTENAEGNKIVYSVSFSRFFGAPVFVSEKYATLKMIKTSVRDIHDRPDRGTTWSIVCEITNED